MAIKFDASGDLLSRSANLPSTTAFTACGWYVYDGSGGDLWATVFALTNAGGNGIWFYGKDDNIGGVASIDTDTTSTVSLGLTVTTGVPYAWTISCAGTGGSDLVGRMRAVNSTTWSTATSTGKSFTPDKLEFGRSQVYTSEWLNGRIWNVKVWDRVLTADELLVETSYLRPVFRTSLNFWAPLWTASDVSDYSGNGRNLTTGGTLTTGDGSHGLWTPNRRRRPVTVAEAAAPTLVSASVINLGATTATPRLTVTR